MKREPAMRWMKRLAGASALFIIVLFFADPKRFNPVERNVVTEFGHSFVVDYGPMPSEVLVERGPMPAGVTDIEVARVAQGKPIVRSYRWTEKDYRDYDDMLKRASVDDARDKYLNNPADRDALTAWQKAFADQNSILGDRRYAPYTRIVPMQVKVYQEVYWDEPRPPLLPGQQGYIVHQAAPMFRRPGGPAANRPVGSFLDPQPKSLFSGLLGYR
jgi:hypothetical protein